MNAGGPWDLHDNGVIIPISQIGKTKTQSSVKLLARITLCERKSQDLSPGWETLCPEPL